MLSIGVRSFDVDGTDRIKCLMCKAWTRPCEGRVAEVVDFEKAALAAIGVTLGLPNRLLNSICILQLPEWPSCPVAQHILLQTSTLSATQLHLPLGAEACLEPRLLALASALGQVKTTVR